MRLGQNSVHTAYAGIGTRPHVSQRRWGVGCVWQWYLKVTAPHVQFRENGRPVKLSRQFIERWKRVFVGNDRFIDCQMRSTHNLSSPVFLLAMTRFDIQADESTRSIMFSDSRRLSSLDTSSRTEKGSLRSPCETGCNPGVNPWCMAITNAFTENQRRLIDSVSCSLPLLFEFVHPWGHGVWIQICRTSSLPSDSVHLSHRMWNALVSRVCIVLGFLKPFQALKFLIHHYAWSGTFAGFNGYCERFSW